MIYLSQIPHSFFSDKMQNRFDWTLFHLCDQSGTSFAWLWLVSWKYLYHSYPACAYVSRKTMIALCSLSQRYRSQIAAGSANCHKGLVFSARRKTIRIMFQKLTRLATTWKTLFKKKHRPLRLPNISCANETGVVQSYLVPCIKPLVEVC